MSHAGEGGAWQKQENELTNPCPHLIQLSFLGSALWSLLNYHTGNSHLCAETALRTDAVTSRFAPPAVFARESCLLPEPFRFHGGWLIMLNCNTALLMRVKMIG